MSERIPYDVQQWNEKNKVFRRPDAEYERSRGADIKENPLKREELIDEADKSD